MNWQDIQKILKKPLRNRNDLKKLSLDDLTKKALYSKNNNELKLIAESTCEYAKTFVARNVNAELDTLNILAMSPTKTVREAVLDNPRTLPSTVKLVLQYDELHA